MRTGSITSLVIAITAAALLTGCLSMGGSLSFGVSAAGPAGRL
jgi:hypothetical protein